MKVKHFNVQELSIGDQQNINGGDLGIGLALLGLSIYLYDNRDRFMEGVRDSLK